MVLTPSFLVLLAFFSVGSALREAKDDEFPFQVSVKSPDNRHLCGGAIITQKWILTVTSCVKGYNVLRVSYGNIDSNNPNAIESARIEQQSGFPLNKRNRLALIKLKEPIKISKTAKPAGLPTASVVLRNTTKLAAWKLTPGVDVPPNLYVSDVYYVIPSDCKSESGSLVHLDSDEFCGMEEEPSGSAFSPGSTVSKAGVALGILSEVPLAMHQPYVFVKLSEHEEWITHVLGSEAKEVNWVNDVPKDSAPRFGGLGLALVGISVIFVRLI